MSEKRSINLQGIDVKLRNSIEERISEFEGKYEADLIKGSKGWVPNIRKLDYVIAIIINLAITFWLIITLI